MIAVYEEKIIAAVLADTTTSHVRQAKVLKNLVGLQGVASAERTVQEYRSLGLSLLHVRTLLFGLYTAINTTINYTIDRPSDTYSHVYMTSQAMFYKDMCKGIDDGMGWQDQVFE